MNLHELIAAMMMTQGGGPKTRPAREGDRLMVWHTPLGEVQGITEVFIEGPQDPPATGNDFPDVVKYPRLRAQMCLPVEAGGRYLLHALQNTETTVFGEILRMNWGNLTERDEVKFRTKNLWSVPMPSLSEGVEDFIETVRGAVRKIEDVPQARRNALNARAIGIARAYEGLVVADEEGVDIFGREVPDA